MKSKFNLFVSFASIVACAITMVQTAAADTGTWSGPFDGTWDTTDVNWSDVAGTPWDFTNGPNNTAVFNTASLAVVVSGPVDTNGITFSTTGALSDSTINLAGTAPAIAVAADQTGSISSTVAGSAGLIKSGAGLLMLSNATFTGGTTVTGGRLVLQNTKTGGSTFSTAGELEFNLTAGDKQLNGGGISGTGKLIKTGGSTLMLGNQDSPQTMALASGALIDVQGGTLRNEYGQGVWTGNKADLNVASGGTFDIWDCNTRVDAVNGTGTIRKGWYNANSLTLGVDNGSGNFNGTFNSAGGDGFSLIKEGTGTQTLSGSIGYNGGTTVNGGRLVLANTMTGSGWYTTHAELEFNLTSGNQQLQNGTFSGTGKLIKTGGSEMILGNWGGAPTIALKGADSVIDVQAGTLGHFQGAVGWGAPAINWAGNEAGLTVAGGATFQINNNNAIVDELNGDGTIRKDNWDAGATLTIGVKDGSGTFSGAIIQGGTTLSLVKQGAGTQTLSGNNNYGGSTTVNAGTLQIGAGGTTGSLGGGWVTVAGTLIFNRSDNYGTGGGQGFSGAGTIIKNGAGDLVFNGGSDHTNVQGISNVVVNDGLIRTDYWGQWNSNLNLTVNGSGKFEMWNTSVSLGNLSGNGTVQNTQNWGRSQTLTVAAGSFSGAIADNGGGTGINLVKSSAGTLTLSGANTYSGTTSVTNGTLALVGGSQASPITVSAGASLGFTLGSPTASTSSFNLTNGTIKITGTPTLPSYTLITSSSGITGTPTLDSPIAGYALMVDGGSLKLVQSAGYSAWAATNAPTGTSSGDYDGDGVKNGTEYVLGGTKATNDLGKLPKISSPGGDMVFTFDRDQDSIDGSTTTVIEVGTNLAIWPSTYTVGANTAGSTNGVVIAKDTSPGFDTVTLTVSRASAEMFARLAVTTH